MEVSLARGDWLALQGFGAVKGDVWQSTDVLLHILRIARQYRPLEPAAAVRYVCLDLRQSLLLITMNGWRVV